MAVPEKRRPENVAGELYVDSTCIDCDTCRQLAPRAFRAVGAQSAVFRQPADEDERRAALRALIACPTASIGADGRHTALLKQVRDEFPLPLAELPEAAGAKVSENVYYCGYHAESSFGAASYFIRRADGNILVDSPRFAKPLVRRLEELGGVRYMYLTHRDDVADHALFHEHFGCERILHEHDVSAGTAQAELKLHGDDVYDLAGDVRIIPVPGHTRGHTVLLYDGQYLFSGDHVAYSKRRGTLTAFRNACWYDWRVQTESMQRLSQFAFEWVLPGHGRRYFAEQAQMMLEMQALVLRMRER